MSLRWNVPRLVVSLALVLIAALMLVFSDYATAGVVALAVIGLVSVGTARVKPS